MKKIFITLKMFVLEINILRLLLNKQHNQFKVKFSKLKNSNISFIFHDLYSRDNN